MYDRFIISAVLLAMLAVYLLVDVRERIRHLESHVCVQSERL